MNKIVLPYQPDKHFNMLKGWYHQWRMNSNAINLLPKTGLIIEDKCALFLYETNSQVCFLEGFICNKDLSKEERTEYFDLIGEVMIHFAKEKGFKYMAGYTKHESVENQLKKFDFQIPEADYHFFCRSI